MTKIALKTLGDATHDYKSGLAGVKNFCCLCKLSSGAVQWGRPSAAILFIVSGHPSEDHTQQLRAKHYDELGLVGLFSGSEGIERLPSNISGLSFSLSSLLPSQGPINVSK